MGELFKRSPSKVWWGNEPFSLSINSRTSSSSPGSQDSGFSDSELHQNSQLEKLKSIFKEVSSENHSNYSNNFVEKCTPTKLMLTSDHQQCFSAPIFKSNRKMPETNSNHSRACRSLFARRKTYSDEIMVTNQYSENDEEYTKHSIRNNNDNNDIIVSSGFEDSSAVETNFSLPNIHENPPKSRQFPNKSAPEILYENYEEYYSDSNENEGITAFNESSDYEENSDYDYSSINSEIEQLFDSDSPKHTSTPKSAPGMEQKGRNTNLQRNLFKKIHENKPTQFNGVFETENAAVNLWLRENRSKCDTECLTSLQCKSIATEINEKIYFLADKLTAKLRDVLERIHRIEHEKASVQCFSDVLKLKNLMLDFIENHGRIEGSNDMLCQYESCENSELITTKLSAIYTTTAELIIEDEIKKLAHKLEFPSSEIELKSTVTAITTLSIRHADLIQKFVELDAIPMLLIHCEKCEGSSTKCFILRTLSTLCQSSNSVKNFEKYSGLQLISDLIQEIDSKPEPEVSEAVTLLAQITAPWIENNYTLRGLSDHAKDLIKNVTKFLIITKCSQNFLLCVAALSNVTSMDANLIKYILQFDTVAEILNKIKRNCSVSIFVLEQIASLIANVANHSEKSRNHLIEINVICALLNFLRFKSGNNHTAEMRLQQKAMVALSQLCSDSGAAQEIVKFGGVKLLIKLCREKDERFNNDAILVAALASLRNIAEKCGSQVMSLQDSQELVEPKLLDSFLAYSNQNESYV